MSIMAPQKDNDFLFASGAGNTAGVFRLSADKPGAQIIWRGKPKESLYAVNATPLVEDGVVYGCDNDSSAFIAAKLENGERLWETKEPTIGDGRGRIGTAFLVKNGDRHFLFNEKGDLILAKISPEKYEELGRVNLLEPTSRAFGRDVVWSHPAFAQKCVFARNDKEIVCADLAE
jgi:outer membrane protein assembly factor BamB